MNDLTCWLRESFFHFFMLQRNTTENKLEETPSVLWKWMKTAQPGADSLHDLPEWLEELSEHVVYGKASIPAAPGPRKASTRISTKTQLPKDRNWEVCRRTKITRARISNHTPHAERFRDLTTADHKVLKEDCESRNSHRYVVIVPDSATQWLLTLSGKAKTLLRKRKRAHESFSSQKRFTRTTRSNLAKSVKGTPAILLQPGLDEDWWDHSMECAAAICQPSKSFHRTGKHLMNGDLETHFVAR